MGKIDRDAMQESIFASMEHSYQHREDSGKFASIFKDGIPTWKCGEGDHEIDMLVYKVGSHHPTRKPPDWDYVLDIWVHYGVGINEDAIVCMNKTYHQRCAVCDYQKKLRERDDIDEDLIKALNPKRRVIYNIVCLDNHKEIDKGIQVWDASHYLMERLLIPITRNKSGDKIFFCSATKGKTVAFTRTGSREKTQIIGHRLMDRTEQYEEEVIDQTFVLDDIIKLPDYKETWEYLDDSEANIAQGEPETRSVSGLRKPLSRKAEEDVDDGDDAGQAPPPRRGARAEEPAQDDECPHGHEFGSDDFDRKKECKDCEVWDNCATAFRNKGGGKQKRTAEPEEEPPAETTPKKRSFAKPAGKGKEEEPPQKKRSLRRA